MAAPSNPTPTPPPITIADTAQPKPPRRPHKSRYQQEEEAMGGPIQRRTDISAHGHWRFGRMIGKGASGRVKMAQHAITQQFAAVKIVPKSAILNSRLSLSAAAEGLEKDERLLMAIEREIVIMKLIDHPNLVKLIDVWETETDMYMLLEYVPNGELFDHICARGRLPPTEALHYFRQIIRGVDYCHRFSIAHRDLKPENLLLDAGMNVKIADFGMATFQSDGALLETSCGSPHYASPEIVSGKPYHGAASDIWSCGIILYALLTGRLPFDDPNIRALLKKVKDGRFNMPADIPLEAQDLMRRMIEVDPTKRITMPDLFNHAFFLSPNPSLHTLALTPVAPTHADLARALSPVELDVHAVHAMRALWRNRDEADIVAALVGEGGCWEKVFYWLLVRYRGTRAVENGIGADIADVESAGTPTPTRATPHPVSPRAVRGTPTPAPRGVAPVLPPRRRPASDPTAPSGAPPAPRPSLPFPADSTSCAMDVDVASTRPPRYSSSAMCVDGSSYNSAESDDEADEADVDMVLDICATSTPRNSSSVDLGVNLNLELPPIELYTPLTEDILGLGLTLSPTVTAAVTAAFPAARHPAPAPPSAVDGRPPSPVPAPSPARALPSMVLGLNIPEVRKDDLAMQAFLRDLKLRAEEAEAAATASAAAYKRPNADDSDWLAVVPPPPGAQSSNTPPTRRRSARTTTAVALPMPQPQREVLSPRPQPPPPRQRRIHFSPDIAAPARFNDEPRRKTISASSRAERERQREDKENQAVVPHARPRPDADRIKERRNTGLGLGLPAMKRESARRISSEVPMPGAYSSIGTRRRAPGTLDLTNFNPTGPYMHANAAHFASVASSPASPPFSQTQSPPLGPSSPVLAGSEPKSTWLASLFNWKGERYELTSGMGVAETRAECQRLLAGMDVQSRLEDDGFPSGEWGLRCWTGRVRFRVSFVRAFAGAGGAGTTMALVQEKGSGSAFRAVYARLRAEWAGAGGLRSPELGAGGLEMSPVVGERFY